MSATDLLLSMSKAGVLPKGIHCVFGSIFAGGVKLELNRIISGTIRTDSYYLEIQKRYLTPEFERILTEDAGKNNKWYEVEIEDPFGTSYLIRIY